MFLAEAVIKLAALGHAVYFASGWNTFDFIVVLIALFEWAMTLAAASLPANPTLLRVIRMVRIMRVLRTLRVVRAARGLKMLLGMLVYSIPTLGNILGIYLILTCMYALLAMQLFGHVVHGQYLTDHANFCTFPRAALTMFRCATGEGWNGLMHDAMVTAERGHCSEADGDCGSWLAIPFFVSYVVLAA